MNWHLESETEWRELASLRGTAILSSRRILPHFERSQKSRFPCEIDQVLQQPSQILKKISHKPNNTVCQSDLGLCACHPAWLCICLFLWKCSPVDTKDMSPLNSQFLLISNDAPGMRASLLDCHILQYMLTYRGPPLFSKDANRKYRFLKHDCFVAEITTASKKP